MKYRVADFIHLFETDIAQLVKILKEANLSDVQAAILILDGAKNDLRRINRQGLPDTVHKNLYDSILNREIPL